jgi:hypothetical protein
MGTLTWARLSSPLHKGLNRVIELDNQLSSSAHQAFLFEQTEVVNLYVITPCDCFSNYSVLR